MGGAGWGVGQQFKQECLEVVVGTVDLVDQEHGRQRARVAQRGEQRPRDQELLAEHVGVFEGLPTCLGQPNPEELAGVVPLVERLGEIDALVALQPNEGGMQDVSQGFRRLRLADTRLPLDEHGLSQPDGAEQGSNRALVG